MGACVCGSKLSCLRLVLCGARAAQARLLIPLAARALIRDLEREGAVGEACVLSSRYSVLCASTALVAIGQCVHIDGSFPAQIVRRVVPQPCTKAFAPSQRKNNASSSGQKAS